MKRHKREDRWRAHASIIAASIFLAVILAKSGLIEQLIGRTSGFEMVGAAIAGFFFSSAFTVAPAIVALGEISREGSLLTTAIIGGAAAMVADVFIFRFLRTNFGDDVVFSAQHATSVRLSRLMRSSGFHWVLIVLGGIVIASPLPDELGLTLMGITRIRLSFLMPLSFAFNTLGILLIGLVARGIA